MPIPISRAKLSACADETAVSSCFFLSVKNGAHKWLQYIVQRSQSEPIGCSVESEANTICFHSGRLLDEVCRALHRICIL